MKITYNNLKNHKVLLFRGKTNFEIFFSGGNIEILSFEATIIIINPWLERLAGK
jgi:hypothetical protein